MRKPNYSIRPLPPMTRTKMLDGVIIPKKPDPVYIVSQAALAWYQTSNSAPFLYLPPVDTYAEADNVRTPHTSIDVLVAVVTPGRDHIIMIGWFDYFVFDWYYYGVPFAMCDDFTPYFWRFFNTDVPNGWQADNRSNDNG